MSETPEISTNDQDRYTVPALERGLRLLACFGPEHPVWSAPELARKLDLPRSTVFRMLTTLENSGYLQRSGTEYRLGLAVLRLGYDYLSTQPLAQLAEPVLQALCDELGMTSNLALRDGTSVVYVARITPSGAFQGAVRVGSRLPAHATVLGRALLHDMDGAQLRSVFGGEELPQFSESTPRNIDELLGLLAQDRERGYAMGEGFYEPGVSSIAAPVRAADGRVVAGLAMAIPFTELGPEKTQLWVEKVQAAAAALSAHLRQQHPDHLR
ncbi:MULTISPECIES: IclR family transcriptional regulator [Comamonas]|uniref:IclR family transcriptional regulator n=1 Tax=Comamonas TaxID=283 RepID=UPI0012CE6E60|nr:MULTISPECIES: IclR family transcriptional regulator [Comamonas]MDR3067321.1 IclR family transcriptional regulator [Comamonas sp.]MEB5966122.1 IclR family transcriptional regulator [Comamonas testosteroni]MPS95930.1 IclR family transcriptional regulator [Comamonas sp.]